MIFIMPPFEEEGVYCFAHVGLSVGLPGGFRTITQERLFKLETGCLQRQNHYTAFISLCTHFQRQ